MCGPYNPDIHETCGLLIEGEDLPPYLSMPWNPTYLAPLVEGAGLTPTRTLYAYHLDLHQGLPDRIVRVSKRLRERAHNLRLRSFDLDRLDDELRLVHRLYNVTLDRNSGFYPLELEDLLASATDLRAFANPEYLIFAEIDGEPVGFMLTLPNFHEILRRNRRIPRRPRFLRILWTLWNLKTRPMHTVRQAVLGIHPDHRDRGLAGLMCAEMVQRTQKKNHSAELSWIESNNEEVIRIIDLMGGVRDKTFRLYHAPIGSA